MPLMLKDQWQLSKRTRSERNAERRFRQRETLKPSLRSVMHANREQRRMHGVRSPRTIPRHRRCLMFA